VADLPEDIRTLIESGIRPVTLQEISSPARRSRPRQWHRRTRTALSLAIVAAVGIPVALIVGSSHPTSAPIDRGTPKHRVLAALNATIDSGSYTVSYVDQPVTGQPAGTTTGIPCAPPQLVVACDATTGGIAGSTVAGQGTIDTKPFAMVASSDVPSVGPVTIRVDSQHIWEIGGANYGLSPGSSQSGPGSTLSGFAGLVEGTLGRRQGGLAMMGLASPTGYLELDQNAITTADRIGTGLANGVPVTIYQVTLDPTEQASVPGTSPDEASAIAAALALLRSQGYVHTTVRVSIDAAGYIRQTASVALFSDGATQTTTATFDHFGCAGQVLMPGQSAPPASPGNCQTPAAP